MPDPFEELETFKQQGLPVNPLPALEVRRRGDRLRRRNNALAAVGGIAAATILVAAPLAIATDGGSRSDRPIPPASQGTDGTGGDATWRRAIPGEFPLAHGLPERNGTGTPVEVLPGYLAQNGIAPCGGDDLEADRPATVVDAATASWSDGVSGGVERNLLLYADGDTAAEVLDGLQERFEGECPAPRTGPGSALLPSALGEDSLVYVDRYRSAGQLTGDGVFHALVRVGNAVLHHSFLFGGAGDEAVVQAELERAQAETAYPVSSMCLFSATPCTEPPPAPADPASAAPIPDGFPLAEGLPEGGELIGPSRQAGGVDLSAMCGTMREVWPADVADRLAVTATVGDFLRTRELVTYPSPETASGVVERLRAAVADCPTADDQAYTPLDDGTDADAVSFAMTTQGGQVAAVHRFVAVGGVVLASFVSGDFTEAELADELASLVEQDAAVLERAAGLAG